MASDFAIALGKAIRGGARGFQGQEQANLADALRQQQFGLQEEQFGLRQQQATDLQTHRGQQAQFQQEQADLVNTLRQQQFGLQQDRFGFQQEQAQEPEPQLSESQVKGKLLEMLMQQPDFLEGYKAKFLGTDKTPTKKPAVTGGQIATLGKSLAPNVGTTDEPVFDYQRGIESAFTDLNRMGLVPGFEFIQGMPPGNIGQQQPASTTGAQLPDFSQMSIEELQRLASGQ